MEGYKFAGGEVSRLTRPQFLFLDRFLQFKIDLKRGKGKKPSRGAPIANGTPEQIHAQMWPRIQKQKEDGLKSEIAAANRAIKTWEEKQKKARAGR